MNLSEKYRPDCWKGASFLTGTKGKAGRFFFLSNNWHELQALTLAFTFVNNFGQ
jgi:hypothetical protein